MNVRGFPFHPKWQFYQIFLKKMMLNMYIREIIKILLKISKIADLKKEMVVFHKELSEIIGVKK
jgi:hypothetical protein